MNTIKKCENALVELGLSNFEASTYLFLLQNSPATGYKVAKGINTSYSNAYKILKSLEKEGYIFAESTGKKMYRALPVDRLLDILEKRFATQKKNIATAIAELPSPTNDQGIYKLKTIEQVYAYSEKMLNECQERALIEIFPEPLNHLKNIIEKTAARGCRIALRVQTPAQIKKVRVVLSPYGKKNISVFKAQWLSIYVDGLQYLQAVLENDNRGVIQAVWSENLYFSRTFYSYLNSDLHHYAFRETLKSAKSADEIRKAYDLLQKEFPIGKDLGYKALIQNIRNIANKHNK